MQVFLPFADFEKSVNCLDDKRLGNQIYRECLTLIRGGWSRHPASKMWHDHKYWLAKYALYGLLELSNRNKYYPHHIDTFKRYLEQYAYQSNNKPVWLGDERLHSSHRSALLYKKYEWYKNYGWLESPAVPIKNKQGKLSLPYYWPI